MMRARDARIWRALVPLVLALASSAQRSPDSVVLLDRPASILVNLYPWASHFVVALRIGAELASRGHSVTFLVPEKHQAALHTYAAERGLATQSYAVILYEACSPLAHILLEEYADTIPSPFTGLKALVAQSSCTADALLNNETTLKAIQNGPSQDARRKTQLWC